MYHPTRGGVRGGRDQFSWDDVKVDKHRENYLGHSIKAPVGRWQKGKDLHWYTRDKKSGSEADALKEEIKRIKEEEEQAMREALGLAPKRSTRPQGNRLDKHEFQELVKRGSTAEDMGAGHSEAAWVHGIGFSSKAPRPWEDPSTLRSSVEQASPELVKPADPSSPVQDTKKEESKDEKEDERSKKKRRREEKKHEKHERREKRHSHGSEDRRKHRKDKEKRRHDSD
ncbi:multiple myeloma tumor-associated protein 2 homolog [Mangifera indica]|uniref:multiple myeloma tumor-associated protein 2 homolog n=1 Tax=Mangifera indica TaxID=29780 RepID=UPI001CFAD63B|nr:multiple myeloma tumor-associated protein 2 homolog [Mangifera indica]